MRRQVFAVTAVACLLSLSPIRLQAQFQDLASLIPQLFDQTVVLFPTGHQAHFVDSSNVLRDAGIQVNSSVVGQLSTFPISSSAGGFTYRYDESLGIFERTTESFGPVFTERAQTIGKGKWNFGFNFFAANYDAIDGLDLRSGEMDFSLTHLDTNNDGTTVETFFEGDLILAEAGIDLSTNNMVLFGTFGVTDRLDLAVAVPIVSVDLDAQLETIVLRQATEGFSDPPVHRFLDGTDNQIFSSGGSESGVGDVLIRAKYNLAQRESAGAAVAVDVRLPTGDEDNLLGTGGTQTKLFFIGSANFARFSPHVNLGYTFSSGGSDLIGDLSDEVNFGAAFDVALHPRVTLSAEGLWRTLLNARQVRERQIPFLFRRFDSTEIESTTRSILQTEEEDLNLVYGLVGLKVNITGSILLTGNLSFSLSNDGLQDEDVIPLIAIDYSF